MTKYFLAMINGNKKKTIYQYVFEKLFDLYHIKKWIKSRCEVKAEKNSRSNWILTHDLCDTGDVLYQLSSLPRFNFAFTGNHSELVGNVIEN